MYPVKFASTQLPPRHQQNPATRPITSPSALQWLITRLRIDKSHLVNSIVGASRIRCDLCAARRTTHLLFTQNPARCGGNIVIVSAGQWPPRGERASFNEEPANSDATGQGWASSTAYLQQPRLCYPTTPAAAATPAPFTPPPCRATPPGAGAVGGTLGPPLACKALWVKPRHESSVGKHRDFDLPRLQAGV